MTRLNQELILLDETDRELLIYTTWSLVSNRTLCATIKGRPCKLSRIVVERATGKLVPVDLLVDHIDGNIFNNGRLNLRIVNKSANALNHASINVRRLNGKYVASLQHKTLKSLDNYEEAVKLYKEERWKVLKLELEKTRAFNTHLTEEEYYIHVR